MRKHPALEFAPEWNAEKLDTEYGAIRCVLAVGTGEEETLLALHRWETLRREVAAWKAVAEIRARQDVFDDAARFHTQELVRLRAGIEANDAQIKAGFLHSPHRKAIERVSGTYALARWETEVLPHAPQVANELEVEASLAAEYVDLVGRFIVSFDGETTTAGRLARFKEHPDREIRRRALYAEWSPYERHQEQLDRIFDGLVSARSAMARHSGYASYTALAYQRLGRIDYGIDEVQALRAEIHDEIVPLAASLVQEQAHSLGLATLEPWDTGVFRTEGLPAHDLGAEHVMTALQRAAVRIDPEIGAFLEELRAAQLLDIEDRAGKVPGAFCSFLPHISMPYVVASVNGSTRAVTSLAHEVGHAFQNYQSRHRTPLEYVVPTNEAGEIHSLGLEFLLWPFYDDVLQYDADRFRANHLRTLLCMLPYIAAIDHFQELVYSQPDCSPEERNEMWRAMERRYMPWRSSGRIPALSRGAAWQAQRHVYLYPFYYIDYAMALCCALDLWADSRADYPRAVGKYLRLCKMGGSLPFRALLQNAGIRSPFEHGALTNAANNARRLISLR